MQPIYQVFRTVQFCCRRRLNMRWLPNAAKTVRLGRAIVLRLAKAEQGDNL